MKHEPTAATMAGIYCLSDMELKDLNTVDIREADQAFRLLCETADGIREELDDTIGIMADPGLTSAAGRTPEGLHEQFTQIYREAIQIAGKSVRLAAVARMAIIRSETMIRADDGKAEGAENGLKRKCDLCGGF